MRPLENQYCRQKVKQNQSLPQRRTPQKSKKDWLLRLLEPHFLSSSYPNGIAVSFLMTVIT